MPATVTDTMYDQSKPSYLPFQWVELEHEFDFTNCPHLKLMAYGAYNAMGLIGPEYGGLALVIDDPQHRFAIAKKFIPHSMLGRSVAFQAVVLALQDLDNPTPEQIVAFVREQKWDQVNA